MLDARFGCYACCAFVRVVRVVRVVRLPYPLPLQRIPCRAAYCVCAYVLRAVRGMRKIVTFKKYKNLKVDVDDHDSGSMSNKASMHAGFLKSIHPKL